MNGFITMLSLLSISTAIHNYCLTLQLPVCMLGTVLITYLTGNHHVSDLTSLAILRALISYTLLDTRPSLLLCFTLCCYAS